MNRVTHSVKTDWLPQIDECPLQDGRTVWVAHHSQLPGITAHASTSVEAANLFQEALQDYFEELRAAGRPLPPPTATILDVTVTSETTVIQTQTPVGVGTAFVQQSAA
jgi:predicted RNase H-like HicB family nuclease